MAIRFSEVLGKMKGSDLGPLLALTAQPDIISFAGGLPAPITFPLKELEEVAVKVRQEDGAGAMQYGPSLGFMGLREAIAARMNRMYVPMGMTEISDKEYHDCRRGRTGNPPHKSYSRRSCDGCRI